tara:strand:+ start:18108 stop:18494 length:387 start_codon:yes stop_codon:yes gene_type:complete
MQYGYTKKVALSFAEATERIKEALASRGFGVLTEIDVTSTLKAKLDIDYDNYLILGACNPTFAYQALQAEKEIGLLLPCNVIVYEKDSEIYVSAILPSAAMSFVQNEQLTSIATDVEQELKASIDSLS